LAAGHTIRLKKDEGGLCIMNTEKKVAFITGANRGIGLETASQLAKLGIVVVIGSRDPAKGEAAAASLRSQGLAVESLRCDVTSAQDRRAAYEYLERKHGKLDILINNAGIAIERFGDSSGPDGQNRTSTTSSQTLRETLEANFFAPIALTQTLLPLIRKSPAGRIVNLSSILGSLTLQATPGSPIYDFKAFAYDTSKAALNSFTIHLAHELRGTPIKVNSAHPGWVKTDMGGPNAPMELADGGRTSVQLATLGADGPTGGFFHLGEVLPW
jgi:NAD(P)-dependent dehydrogenase (short-subunit alcohol dehydrogenase family)